MTVRDALAGLPDPKKKGHETFLNHKFNPARAIGHTGSPLDEPGKTLKAGDHGFRRLCSLTLMGAFVTSRFGRARVFSFPDDYAFEGLVRSHAATVCGSHKLATVVAEASKLLMGSQPPSRKSTNRERAFEEESI